jgi:hypothetical protein
MALNSLLLEDIHYPSQKKEMKFVNAIVGTLLVFAQLQDTEALSLPFGNNKGIAKPVTQTPKPSIKQRALTKAKALKQQASNKVTTFRANRAAKKEAATEVDATGNPVKKENWLSRNKDTLLQSALPIAGSVIGTVATQLIMNNGQNDNSGSSHTEDTSSEENSDGGSDAYQGISEE